MRNPAMSMKKINALAEALKANRNLLKSALYINALRVIQIILSLATTYYLVRALSKDSYGEYHFILTCVGILTVFSLQGLNDSIMQAIARGFAGTYRKAVPIAFLGSFAGSAFLAGMAGWNFIQGRNELAWGFIIAALLFPFTQGLTQWRSVNIGSENFLAYFLHNSASMLLMYPLMIYAAMTLPGTFLPPLALMLGIPALQNVALTGLNYLKIRAEGAPVEEGSIAYGVKTTFYSALGTVAMHIDKLLLFYFLTPSALATYVVAERVSELFRSIIPDSSTVLIARFAKAGSYTSRMDRYLKLCVVLFGAAVIALAFTALPWMITFFFGANYGDAIPYAQALLCSVAIGNLATLQFRFIRSRIDSESFRNITVLTSVGRIIASVSLIPWLGITGAVISVFLYRILLSIVVNKTIKRHYLAAGGCAA